MTVLFLTPTQRPPLPNYPSSALPRVEESLTGPYQLELLLIKTMRAAKSVPRG